MTAPSLKAALAEAAAAVDGVIDALLPRGDGGPEARLFDAMRYAALGPGKRLRPFLVLAGARMLGVPDAQALRVGAALEIVHSYSLVHDDLPAMDDDELRRGRPTLHVAYDEATAILAGDALLTLAFEILGEPATHPDPAVRAELVVALARGAGGHGMAGGQMLDLLSCGGEPDAGQVARMERLKTGALFAFACEAGAILAKAGEPERAALHAYAYDMGLAFQIADDILDETGSEAEMGKRLKKDAGAGKATLVGLLGLDDARKEAAILVDQAIAHLHVFGPAHAPWADLLRETARFVIERRA